MVICVQYGLTCIQEREVSSSKPLKTKKAQVPFYPVHLDFKKIVVSWKVPRLGPSVLLLRVTCR